MLQRTREGGREGGRARTGESGRVDPPPPEVRGFGPYESVVGVGGQDIRDAVEDGLNLGKGGREGGREGEGEGGKEGRRVVG